MKKILCYICEHLRIVATTIYSLILIIIFLFPPLDVGYGDYEFVYLFGESAYLSSLQPTIFYSEIVIVSLIYFAFMLFVIKKWKKKDRWK